MFRERAFSAGHLTATTQPAATTHRVYIYTEYARSVQQRRAHREGSTAARWRKNYLDLLRTHAVSIVLFTITR